METHWIPSTVMSEARYDPVLMTMEIVFRTGEVYRYAAVPREVFDGLVHPPDKSAGRYFKTHIEGVYPFERVTDLPGGSA